MALWKIKRIVCAFIVTFFILSGFVSADLIIDPQGDVVISGDANVSGNANVSGDANVSGNVNVTGKIKANGNGIELQNGLHTIKMIQGIVIHSNLKKINVGQDSIFDHLIPNNGDHFYFIRPNGQPNMRFRENGRCHTRLAFNK